MIRCSSEDAAFESIVCGHRLVVGAVTPPQANLVVLANAFGCWGGIMRQPGNE